MSSKRPGFSIGDMVDKRTKLDEQTGSTRSAGNGAANQRTPFLSHPVEPEKALQQFLQRVRTTARSYLPKETKFPVHRPFCEIEARLGILKINNRRVTSSGVKRVQGKVVHAFDCSKIPHTLPSMESGVSRSNYVHWTQAGLSEPGPLTAALGATVQPSMPLKEAIAIIKRDLVEREYVETVFAGYPQDRRVSFPGLVSATHPRPEKPGQMEYKEKLDQMDLTFPAAKYDIRINLASEKVVDPAVTVVPPGWKLHRIKRRRSYCRRDGKNGWQVDVTEVTSTQQDNPTHKTVAYEIEMELKAETMLQLVNEENPEKLNDMTKTLGQQLWWILSQINASKETVDVDEYLQDHPNKNAVQLALATCGAIKKFMETAPSPQSGQPAPIELPIGSSHPTPAHLANINFCGCMPVNFSRHNIEDIQNSPENGYFLSEKTDGVRHFMVFTGDTVVLVDRAMRGKQVVPARNAPPGSDPMAHVIPLIQKGTVLDGEVVMHRGNPGKHPARPIFIVFDVLTLGANAAVLHLHFEQRLRHLKQATFRTTTANKDMFEEGLVANPNIPLPLVRKNFVHRTSLRELLGNVIEDKGARSYRKLPVHNHLTDGIIFQPNLPYVCGTDVKLLKWKYLDTVSIDVELLPPRHHFDQNDDALNVGVMGNEQTTVDMSRYVLLPKSERYRLEADKFESQARIAEVGFDPEIGEWYYLTMRPDKIAPNHISTVLGTLLELSESLTAEELQYRMSVPPGHRDTYRKDFRKMLGQMLDFQKQSLQRK